MLQVVWSRLAIECLLFLIPAGFLDDVRMLLVLHVTKYNVRQKHYRQAEKDSAYIFGSHIRIPKFLARWWILWEPRQPPFPRRFPVLEDPHLLLKSAIPSQADKGKNRPWSQAKSKLLTR